jgi:hypothetical protein
MSQYVPALGKLIESNAFRDAVHIAVAPVVAGETLSPGRHVKLGDDLRATSGGASETIGIVDPFLTADVQQGQRFWLFLYPNTVTGLRHAWTHPAFKPKAPALPGGATHEGQQS